MTTRQEKGNRRAKAAALVATIAIHGLMMYPVIKSSAQGEVYAFREGGLGASKLDSVGEPRETLFLVNLPQPSALETHRELTSTGALLTDPSVTILADDSLPSVTYPDDAIIDADAQQEPESESASVRAQMFGRYRGQISARINRVWRRPRTSLEEAREGLPPSWVRPSSGERFHCQARISQGAAGEVQEIELIGCNGTVAWQQSLARAIQAASPLPAPPIPSVFSTVITLAFESDLFSPSASAEGFETEYEFNARSNGEVARR